MRSDDTVHDEAVTIREKAESHFAHMPLHRHIALTAIAFAEKGDWSSFERTARRFFPETERNFRRLCAEHGLVEKKAG